MSPESVSLANELRPILLRLNRQLRREAHPLGVTGGQVALLGAISKRPGVGVRALAIDEGVSAAAISVQVRRLVDAGLVGKVPGSDRRRVGLTITAAGLGVLRSVRSRRTAWLATRLGRLDSNALRRVDEALEPLHRLLDANE